MEEEMDYEELRKNPGETIELGNQEIDELLEHIDGVENNNEKLRMYQDAIRGANIRIEDIEAQIDLARIEYDKKIEELTKLLEQEEERKAKIKQAKDNLISKIQGNKQQEEKFNENGYNKEGYDREGYDKWGFNEKGIHKETGTEYNLDGFDKNGIHKETGTEYGPDSFNRRGYDRESYDREGYHFSNGYNREGYNRKGYNAYGYTIEGFSEDGKYDPIFDFSDKKEERVKALKADQKEKEQNIDKKENPERERKERKIGDYRDRFKKLNEEEKDLLEKFFGPKQK